MNVSNYLPYPVIAHSFNHDIGYGEDVVVQHNESVDVPLPLLAELAKCNFRVASFNDLRISIICAHEKRHRYIESISIEQGKYYVIVFHRSDDRSGVVIRHHTEDALRVVRDWREKHM